MAKKKKQPKYIFPIISRVSAKTIGLDLVSVIPMPKPSDFLIYFDIDSEEQKKEKLKAKLNTLITGEIPEKYKKKNG